MGDPGAAIGMADRMAAMGLGPVAVVTVRMVPIVRLSMRQPAATARMVRTAVHTAAGEAVYFMVG